MKKLFILDDDEDIVKVLHHVLRNNYIIQFKTDAAQIADAILDFNPDLIILDNFIGATNAGEVIATLRQHSPSPLSAPVILFSAAPNIAETATLLGADGYLEKPASINKIRDYVKQMLEN